MSDRYSTSFAEAIAGALKRYGKEFGPVAFGVPKVGVRFTATKALCPECMGFGVYDRERNELACLNCGLVFAVEPPMEPMVRVAIEPEEVIESVESGETRVLLKERVPGEGLKLIISSTQVSTPSPVYNPLRGIVELRNVRNIIFDASIPEAVYQRYEDAMRSLSTRDKVIYLLGLVGVGYPSSAIRAIVVDAKGNPMSSTNLRQIVYNNKDLLASFRPQGGALRESVAYGGEVYKVGSINEIYRALTPSGLKVYQWLDTHAPKSLEAYGRDEEGRLIREPPFTKPREETPAYGEGVELIGRGGVVYPWIPPSERGTYKPYVEPAELSRAGREERGVEWTPLPSEIGEYRPDVVERVRRLHQRRSSEVYLIPSEDPRRRMIEEIREQETGIQPYEECTHPVTYTTEQGEEVCLVCGRLVEK